MIYVQFSDSAESEIVTYFGGAQDPDVYQNLGVVVSSDPRWKTFYEALPAPTQAGLPAPAAS